MYIHIYKTQAEGEAFGTGRLEQVLIEGIPIGAQGDLPPLLLEAVGPQPLQGLEVFDLRRWTRLAIGVVK